MSDDHQDDIEFGPLSESDFAGISDLITRMSSIDAGQRLRDKTEDYYRWMYGANPSGRAIVHSARHGATVVSSFAIAPKTFQIDGRIAVLGKTMDMFTDPDYQGRGLIKKCTEAVFEEARESGIEGWYVTPSVNSYPIFRGKWGYREDLQLIYRSRVLDYSKVLHVAVHPPRLGRLAGILINALARPFWHRRECVPRGYEVTVITRFGPDVDKLWASVASGYRVALVRDAQYLNWRYVDNPDTYLTYGLNRNEELVGLIVLRTTLRRGVEVGEIMDYLCPADEPEILNLLVHVALVDFKDRGCGLAQAWSIKGTRLDQLLKRAGLRLRRDGVKFLISPELATPAMHDPEAWLLTQGDGNDV